MKIEYLSTRRRERPEAGPEFGAPASPDVGMAHYLVNNVRPGEYDSNAAAFFATASAWAYADLDTMARTVCRRGLDGECVALTVTNPAIFVDTTAYVIQNAEEGLVILGFRGTEPTNLINWLMDVSFQPDPFLSAGHVHGGFYRSGIVLWSMLRRLLIAASEDRSIKEEYDRMTAEEISCAPAPPPAPVPVGKRKFKALYIFGHSLGGAHAALAGAAIHLDPTPGLIPVAEALTGVYTYGAPMPGDAIFADALEKKFGDKLFRHVYGKDPVPRLPPRTAGDYKHFGREYASTGNGWTLRPQAASQALSVVGSTLIGVFTWVMDQLPFLEQLPGMNRIPWPYRWGDHSPTFYMRESQAFRPGFELL